ncbi:unnamed protein product [Ectocarpus sp. 6 AP-2014]
MSSFWDKVTSAVASETNDAGAYVLDQDLRGRVVKMAMECEKEPVLALLRRMSYARDSRK